MDVLYDCRWVGERGNNLPHVESEAEPDRVVQLHGQRLEVESKRGNRFAGQDRSKDRIKPRNFFRLVAATLLQLVGPEFGTFEDAISVGLLEGFADLRVGKDGAEFAGEFGEVDPMGLLRDVTLHNGECILRGDLGRVRDTGFCKAWSRAGGGRRPIDADILCVLGIDEACWGVVLHLWHVHAEHARVDWIHDACAFAVEFLGVGHDLAGDGVVDERLEVGCAIIGPPFLPHLDLDIGLIP